MSRKRSPETATQIAVRTKIAVKRLTFLIVLIAAAATFAEAAETKRPNILFIIADDQSPFDLKIYNAASTLETPVLDRLAAAGMVFDGAHHMGSWAGGVCTPSRHMIMSGRSVWHIPDRSKFQRNPNSDESRFGATRIGRLHDGGRF